jgi:hypothetical protein
MTLRVFRCPFSFGAGRKKTIFQGKPWTGLCFHGPSGWIHGAKHIEASWLSGLAVGSSPTQPKLFILAVKVRRAAMKVIA